MQRYDDAIPKYKAYELTTGQPCGLPSGRARCFLCRESQLGLPVLYTKMHGCSQVQSPKRSHTCGWLIESTHVFSLLLCTDVFSERNTALAHPASPPSAASLGSGISKLGTKCTASALVRLGGAVHSWTWARRALVPYRQSPHRRRAAGGFRRLSAVSFAGDRAGDHRPHRQPPSRAPRRNPPACPDDETRSWCSRRCTPGSPTRPSPPVACRKELGELVLFWGHGRC